MFAPQPLGVGREALVEPGLIPRIDGEVIAEPLVRKLVDDDEVIALARAEEERRVVRAGLVLESEPDGAVMDDAARRREWVRPEQVGLPGDDLRLPVEGQQGARADSGNCGDFVPRSPRVLVVRAARGPGDRGDPAVEGVAIIFEAGIAHARGDDELVEDHASALDASVARIRERHLDLAGPPRRRRQARPTRSPSRRSSR